MHKGAIGPFFLAPPGPRSLRPTGPFFRRQTKSGTIHLYRPKVSNRSILYMTERLKRIMQRRWENKTSDWVFTDKTGKKPRGCNDQAIRKAFKRVGLEDFHVHDLRHVFGARMVSSGMSLYETQKLLGHATPAMTQRYAFLAEQHVSAKAQKILDEMAERIEEDKIGHLVEFD